MSSSLATNKTAIETDRAARLSLPPPREFMLPGGPYRDRLGTVYVYKLAEIERGGPRDIAR